MDELNTIKAAYIAAVSEFNVCKNYCIANSAICAWSVLWMLRDEVIELQAKLYNATRKMVRTKNNKLTAEEIEKDTSFMDAFYKAADADESLCAAYFLNPETTIEKYYDLTKK